MEQGCPVSGCWMLLLLFRDPFLLADVRWPVSCSVPGPVPSLFWSDSCLLQLSSQVCWVWGGGASVHATLGGGQVFIFPVTS